MSSIPSALLDHDRPLALVQTPPFIHDAAPLRKSAPLSPPSAPSMRQRRLQAYIALMVADGAAILLGYAAAEWIAPHDATIPGGQLLLPVYWAVALARSIYTQPALTDRILGAISAIATLVLAGAIMLFVGHAFRPDRGLDIANAAVGLLPAACLMVLLRVALRPAIRLRCGQSAENLLVIDDDEERTEHLSVPEAYHVNARDHGLSPDLLNPHMLDRIGRYMTHMDRVLVSCPPSRRMAWSLVFRSANVSGAILENDLYDVEIIGSRREGSHDALIVSCQPLSMHQRAMKRAFDVVMAGSAIIALAPLLALVALAIKLGDGGPVLFVQARTGRNNCFFPIYKFRSMRVERTDATGARSASLDDDRITPIGRLIRRTSIDELPQLFNVLLGHMSMVGPRPHAIGSLAGDNLFWEVDRRYWLRHAVKPGLTGLAQVRGLRGATHDTSDLTRRLQADLEYLAGWTIWRDLAIVLGTLRVVVHDRAF